MHREIINKENIKEDKRRKRKFNTFKFCLFHKPKGKRNEKKKINRLVQSLYMEILVVGI